MNNMYSKEDVLRFEVIRQAQAGDEESLSELTRQVTGAVGIYIYRLTLNHDLAEDLTQETMLNLLKRLTDLRCDTLSGFWAWTYRTARGTVQHHYRKQRRRRRTSLSEIDQDMIASPHSTEGEDASDRLIHKEMMTAVLYAMGALKLEHRDVLVLRCLHEMSYAQIATILGGTELRARLLFLRAKKSLKRRLADQQFDKKHLPTALGLFGFMTAASRTTARAVSSPVATETLRAGGVASSLCALTTVPGCCVFVLIAITLVFTAAKNPSSTLPPRPATPPALAGLPEQTNMNQMIWQTSVQISSWLARISQPQNEPWYALDPGNPERPPFTAEPRGFFYPQRSQFHALLFPKGYSVDFALRTPLQDESGADVFMLCVPGKRLANFYLVDSSERAVPIAPMSFQRSEVGLVWLGFDLASLSNQFLPTLMRVEGTDPAEPGDCFGVLTIRARSR